MPEQKIIPTFDLYKTLDSNIGVEFSLLEESYNAYDASSPHRHNYYEVLLFNEGGGTHEIDFSTHAIGQNALHFISPEQVHLLRREKHVTGYVLSFTPDFVLGKPAGVEFIDDFPFFNNPYATPIVSVDDDDQKNDLHELISKIQAEYFSSNTDKVEILLSYLTILLITAKRIYHNKTIPEKLLPVRKELSYKFRKLVDQNFRQMKSVADYASLLNITSGHLNDTVQKETGKTAGAVIHDRIILETKRLLYHSPKSVKEIAYELNYDDPSYFNRFFKMQTQMTPEQFRQHIREKYH